MAKKGKGDYLQDEGKQHLGYEKVESCETCEVNSV